MTFSANIIIIHLLTKCFQSLLTPQTNFYTKLGQECVAAGCSVDIFLFPNGYVDVATVSEVPRLTGGAVYKYAYFQVGICLLL